MGTWRPEIEEAIEQIWWVTRSIGITLLWQVRNHIVHGKEQWSAKRQLRFMRLTVKRQLEAVAAQASRAPATKVKGLVLKITLEVLYNTTSAFNRAAQETGMPSRQQTKGEESQLARRLRLYISYYQKLNRLTFLL